jgi:hypothetical protein
MILQLEDNPLTTSHFLDVLTLYARVILAAASFEEARVVVAGYNRALILNRTPADPDFQS